MCSKQSRFLEEYTDALDLQYIEDIIEEDVIEKTDIEKIVTITINTIKRITFSSK